MYAARQKFIRFICIRTHFFTTEKFANRSRSKNQLYTAAIFVPTSFDEIIIGHVDAIIVIEYLNTMTRLHLWRDSVRFGDSRNDVLKRYSICLHDKIKLNQ